MKYFYSKKKKKTEKIPRRYTIEASSGNQIIEIQLQLYVTLYCFKEVPLICLIVAKRQKKGKNKQLNFQRATKWRRKVRQKGPVPKRGGDEIGGDKKVRDEKVAPKSRGRLDMSITLFQVISSHNF